MEISCKDQKQLMIVNFNEKLGSKFEPRKVSVEIVGDLKESLANDQVWN